MQTAPIAIFTYNRLEHARRVVQTLARNELASESALYLFSDGPRSAVDAEKVDSVRKFLGSVAGFRSVDVIERPSNLGLATSIIRGVTEMCEQHGRVIVLEDDLVTAPFFLRYMNDALNLYEDTEEVVSIHGYVYPVREKLPETFFIKGADCWGWATWQRGWAEFEINGSVLLHEIENRGLTKAFDFDGNHPFTAMLRDQIAGRNDSWAIRWYASAFLRDRLTLYPGRSLVSNIGHDGSGMHCTTGMDYDIELSTQPIRLEKIPVRENMEARAEFTRYFQNQSRASRKRAGLGRIGELAAQLRQLCANR